MASSAFRKETTDTYLSNQSEVSSSLGGFIFLCNQYTISQQLQHHLFALPIEYLDRVKAIRPGLPLFLYNSSDRRLHGVFEAACNGGLNLRNPPGKHMSAEQSGRVFESQYPAQVKMHVRERRPSLDIDQVRSVLHPHDHHEFQLELSPTEVESLLRLFDCKNRKVRRCKNAEGNINGKSCFAESPKDEISNICFGSHKATLKVSIYATSTLPSKGMGDKTIFPRYRSILSSNTVPSSNGVLESPARGLKKNETFWRKKEVSTGPVTNNSADCAGMAVLPMGKNGSNSGDELVISEAEANSLQNLNHNINGELLNLSGQKFHERSDTNNRKAFLKSHKICGNQKYVYVESNAQHPCKNFESCKNVEKPRKHNDKEQIFDKEQKQKQKTQQGILEQHLLSSPMSAVSFVPYVLQIPFLYSNVPVADSLSHFCHSSSYSLEEYIYAPLGSSIFSSTHGMLEGNEVNMHALHSEIVQFAHNVRPSDAVYQQVQAAVECVRLEVKHCWPNKDIEVYGSFATGLCISQSDIDVVVVGCQTALETTLEKEGTLSLIRKLAKQLTGCSWCEGLYTIESAPIPVIKLNCNPTVVVSSNEGSCLEPIAIDITIGGRNGLTDKNIHSGVHAREFVLHKLHQFPSLVPLVLLLKSYLHHKGLNTVYFGGLSSYSLTLMLVFYLEQMFPAFPDMSLPSASLKPVETLCLFGKDSSVGEPVIKRAKYVIDQLLRLLDTSVGFPNLGTLLLGFLTYFGSFIDFSRMRIVLQGKDGNPGGIFWQSERQTPAPLYIEDPLRPGVNVGAGSFAMCHVQTAFVEMLQILTRPLPDTLNHTKPISSQSNSLPYLDQLFYKTGN
ncbi:uncharacterized protein LOC131074957 isoform X1 [Cryptomeria japonica]|uniref:uncharacterized protein LOC131074957 isoform X1 n=2 Tax=Cryptomeria japonica TaxID=3369 RepID=UPI0027DA21BA|nr:uncharacterized protein LOC131074957 isoform X1 [Cryptomeria japonica]